MTSYSKKLYERDPASAHTLRKRELHDYRYGKHVTLTCFAADTHLPFRPASTNKAQHGNGNGAGLAANPFGKRVNPPALPAYECWAPELANDKVKWPAATKRVVWASNGFEARRQFAMHHGIAVSEVAARRMQP